MAVRIEVGGRVLMFLAGLGLLAWGLDRYGVLDLGRRIPWLPPRPQVDHKPEPAPETPTAELGRVRVRFVARGSCAPGLVANGGLETAPRSGFGKRGLKVVFKPAGSWTEMVSALAGDSADVIVTTADAWARESAMLRERGAAGRAFLLAGWSRGADGILAAEGIKNVAELAGKTIAYEPRSPSHFLLWSALKSSGLGAYERKDIFARAVETASPAGVFAEGKADAAADWDPPLSGAAEKRPGSSRIYDTKTAGDLIADILVVSQRFAADHRQAVAGLAEGWLEATESLERQTSPAASLIGGIEELRLPEADAARMLAGVRLADYAENVAFFRKGSESGYERLFRSAQQMLREISPATRRLDPEAVLDRAYLEGLESHFQKASSLGGGRLSAAAGSVRR